MTLYEKVSMTMVLAGLSIAFSGAMVMLIGLLMDQWGKS